MNSNTCDVINSTINCISFELLLQLLEFKYPAPLGTNIVDILEEESEEEWSEEEETEEDEMAEVHQTLVALHQKPTLIQEVVSCSSTIEALDQTNSRKRKINSVTILEEDRIDNSLRFGQLYIYTT